MKRTVQYSTASVIDGREETMAILHEGLDVAELENGVDRVGRIWYWANETFMRQDIGELIGVAVVYIEDIESGHVVKVNPLGIVFNPWDNNVQNYK